MLFLCRICYNFYIHELLITTNILSKQKQEWLTVLYNKLYNLIYEYDI